MEKKIRVPLVNLWHNSCVVHAEFRHLILFFGRCVFWQVVRVTFNASKS